MSSSLVAEIAAMAAEIAAMAEKLRRSVGKAAWLAGTTFLVLGLPLLIVLDREKAEIEQMEFEQQSMQAILGVGGGMDYS